jgi:SAM-dependent methyltransferase
MRKQKQVWEKEHDTAESLPSLALAEPSEGVVAFVEWLGKHGVRRGKIVDIGCGKGRNTVYLARQGFEVHGIDYIKSAIDKTDERARENNVVPMVRLHQAEIDAPWPFPERFFDAAVDNLSSVDIETQAGRDVYKKELLRTLKPGGYAFVAVVAAHDVVETELLKISPGPERNSTIWPSGKFEKVYDEAELREFYKDFEILELREVKKPGARKLGKVFTATNYWLTLQKP